MARTTILLVDDHRIVRQGVKLILENCAGMEVVGEATDAAEALAKAATLRPDVVIMDVHLAAVDGIDACGRILAADPAVKIVVLSSDCAPETVQRALQSGASGYVLKDAAGEELVRAINTVRSDRLYLCPEVTTALFRAQMVEKTLPIKPTLTERDKELLRFVAGGLRNKEIAVHLGLSIKSVEASRSRLMAKLGYTSPAELVRYAVREGIAPP